MSKINQKPIEILKGAELEIDGSNIKVKGPLGSLSYDFPSFIQIINTPEGVNVAVQNSKNKEQRSMEGTAFRLIKNMVHGVVVGYEKKLQLLGIGFNAKLEGNNLILNLGFSHSVKFIIPGGIKAAVEKNTIISLKGIDRSLVGETAAKIRALRKPDVYHGKGIKYENEILRKKEVKKVVTAAA